jgi:phosphoglucomutase
LRQRVAVFLQPRRLRRLLARPSVEGDIFRIHHSPHFWYHIPMALSPLAGKPAPANMLINVDRLISEFIDRKPDMSNPRERVSFGTSGHRGTPMDGTFTRWHILAITQAIVEYRKSKGIDGPVYMGKDTHALSGPAQMAALEVLAANGIETLISQNDTATPTPVVSWAILSYNKGRQAGLSDGIIITPSHNPPEDGGFKYNPPNGGPADTDVTNWIQERANTILENDNREVKLTTFDLALKAATTHQTDLIWPYVKDLQSIVDTSAIAAAKIKIGVDPLGGASLPYWGPIGELYKLDLTVVNKKLDPTFSFMPVDHDGKIRMDCSSPYAMANLVKLKNDYRIAFGNDPDSDRHGIVTPSAGLMNPNHYLAVAINYLLTHRPNWPGTSAIGKTVVSSSMIDRVVKHLGRTLCEVPVGFKWFSSGLFAGTLCFGGEESAGASFLKLDGSVWSTDKDGIILNLLAAEITAITRKDPGEHYADLTTQFGNPKYTRIDASATPQQKAAFKKLTPESVTATDLAGEKIIAKLTKAPGNHASIGGLKVVTEKGWFAARPSGTEDIYKVYAESFVDEKHLSEIVEQAQAIVTKALG